MKTAYRVSWSNSSSDRYSRSFDTEEEREEFIKNLSTKNIQTWENQITIK